MMLFTLHIILFGVLYLSSLLLHVYKRKHDLNGDYFSKLWDNGRQMVASLWDLYGKLWHGYELHGVEKIPEGPGLIVYYHGAAPLDYLYFVAKLCSQKGRLCHSVVDHFTFKIPGIKLLLDIFGMMHGGRDECVQILKNGHLLGVSPGGVREAFFSDENYNLLWGHRKGFAQVAIDAKVAKIAIQSLRDRHQKTPGNILRALLERFDKYQKDD
uniref:Phospholipid/glycerol acyltransferase domain-containing protein n=1 Tax=Pelusios castaneus TaxID=367368 RepID=A0A8C8S7T3_9SAUR